MTPSPISLNAAKLSVGHGSSDNDYYLSEILTKAIQLSYSIVPNPTGGGQPLTPGTVFPFTFKMKASFCDNPGHADQCQTSTFTYTFNFKLQINLMTCGFNGQIIDMGSIALSDLLSGVNLKQNHIVNLDCKQDGVSGALPLEAGKVDYHFEESGSGILQDGNNITLKNTLERIDGQGGAGDVGFRLIDIPFGEINKRPTDNKATLGSNNPILLTIEPVKYGNNIGPGKIETTIKLVVDNN